MPKVALLNNETGKIEEFEPVDAREILSQENTIYGAPPKKEEAAGGAPQGVSIPQLQGADAEMQTGLSIEKYGRSNVVKAEPGNPELTPVSPQPNAQTRLAPAGQSDQSGDQPVTIPESWRELSWQQKRALASQVSDEPIRNGDDADKAIEAELQKRQG